MFEKASRMKLRFETGVVGNLNVEDLWDLPLVNSKVSLDLLAKKLNKEIKENEEESFVVERSTANTTLKLKFDIVKHIIKVKLEEKEASEKAVKNKAKKEKIMTIIAAKEDETLTNMSVEDLQALLEE